MRRLTGKRGWILAAIVPAYNEKGRVGPVVRALSKFVDTVIFVDDGSSDGTFEEVSSLGLRNVVAARLPVNCGKGAALRAGFSIARKLGANEVATVDSDGQHPPSLLPDLLKKLRRTGADIVVGCREFSHGMPVVKRLGNRWICFLARFLFGIPVSDPLSGFRVFSARAIRNLEWKSSGYSVEIEVLARARKCKLIVSEMKIPTIYADKYKGTGVGSGVRITIDMLKGRVFGWFQ
ncbi:MAG: glycosyltransferase family 2 protein [archaeon]